MPTFVYMTRCDGCGQCVDICPSDIMHIDKTYRRALNIEPNFCWECYSCVKAWSAARHRCPRLCRLRPLGHSVRVLREEAKATISWKLQVPRWPREEFRVADPHHALGIDQGPGRV